MNGDAADTKATCTKSAFVFFSILEIAVMPCLQKRSTPELQNHPPFWPTEIQALALFWSTSAPQNTIRKGAIILAIPEYKHPCIPKPPTFPLDVSRGSQHSLFPHFHFQSPHKPSFQQDYNKITRPLLFSISERTHFLDAFRSSQHFLFRTFPSSPRADSCSAK